MAATISVFEHGPGPLIASPARSGLAALAIAVLCATGCDARSGAAVYSAGTSELRGSVFSRPVPRPTFTFTDDSGLPYDFLVRTEGKLTFLFFGFTSCPDVCPVHMAGLASAISGLSREDQSRIEVVFVTVDPERDTPERVRAWLDSFSPDFVGLIPTLDEANAVLADMYIAGATHVPKEDGEGYDVLHPAAVFAFSPDGPARVRYGFGTRRADWSHDLPMLLGRD